MASVRKSILILVLLWSAGCYRMRDSQGPVIDDGTAGSGVSPTVQNAPERGTEESGGEGEGDDELPDADAPRDSEAKSTGEGGDGSGDEDRSIAGSIAPELPNLNGNCPPCTADALFPPEAVVLGEGPDARCILPFTGIEDRDLINVQFTLENGDFEIMSRYDTERCAGERSGWYYTTVSSDGGQEALRIQLCGETCERVKRILGTGARVEVLCGCTGTALDDEVPRT